MRAYEVASNARDIETAHKHGAAATHLSVGGQEQCEGVVEGGDE